MTWNRTTLGAISLGIQPGPFGSQLHSSDYSSSGTPIIMPKDMIDGRVDTSSLNFISDDHVNRLSRHQAHVGDIVHARKGDVTKCVYIDKQQDGWLTGSDCLKIVLDADSCVGKFVYYALQAPMVKKWLEMHAIGATMPSVNSGILADIPLMIPERAVQDRIVEILSRYDALIGNYRAQIQLLEEAAERLYKEWFVKFHYPGWEKERTASGGVPEGWEQVPLTKVADIQYGYPFDGSKFNTRKDGMPIIRIRNIPDGTTEDYTTEKAKDQYVVHNGDILVGMDGEFHINIWSGSDAYLVQRCLSVRPHDRENIGFLLEAIRRPIKYFESINVGATVGHLGKSDVDSIILMIPDKTLRIPFQDFYLRRLFLLNEARMLQEARDRLLPRLMNGEIDVEKMTEA